MAKAIYSLKLELLFEGNETVMKLKAHELVAIQRFNRFVVLVYIQSWFTSRSAVDAAANDIRLISRLKSLDDNNLKSAGLKPIQRHSWYLSPEVATLDLFSSLVSSEEKAQLVTKVIAERGSHLLTILPDTISDLTVSRTFFSVLRFDDSFLSVPVTQWEVTPSFIVAKETVQNLTCVNDCAERGVALIHDFNTSTKDEVQKQYLLQVVEQHRHTFQQCNLSELHRI